jgi:tyrosine-protein phosphatase YwqE
VLDQPDLLRRWKDAGAYLQVNYGSFVGRYGAAPQSIAYQIMEAGLADYLSSDFHGQSGLKLYKREAWEALSDGGSTDLLETLCRVNPSRLIEGLEPLPVAPLPASSRLFQRIRTMMRRRNRSVRGRVR